MDKASVAELFATIDRKDAEGFASFLTEDAVFRFGSAEPARGRPAVAAAVAGFFLTVHGLSHRILEVWSVPRAEIVEGEVTYTRLDGSKVTLPFVDILRLRGEKISEYLIYMDPAPLFQPPVRTDRP